MSYLWDVDYDIIGPFPSWVLEWGDPTNQYLLSRILNVWLIFKLQHWNVKQFRCSIDAAQQQMALNFESVVSDQLFSVVLATYKWFKRYAPLVFGSSICDSWITKTAKNYKDSWSQKMRKKSSWFYEWILVWPFFKWKKVSNLYFFEA